MLTFEVKCGLELDPKFDKPITRNLQAVSKTWIYIAHNI